MYCFKPVPGAPCYGLVTVSFTVRQLDIGEMLFLEGRYGEVEMPGCKVCPTSMLLDTAKLFSKVAIFFLAVPI